MVLGVKTNIGFLTRVLNEEEFVRCEIDTGYIGRHPELLVPGNKHLGDALIAAAICMREATTPQANAAQAASSNWKAFGRRLAVTRNALL
ncbi:MAG: hypothetical protein QXX77_10335, partial [Candidatus Methanosuratincola sp.]